ncbi:hypothetical protein FHS18_000472 [Paenibacillus phyllosphaerae]|uniref:Uncharacterized protein n=1 Tax=Paenibacillus phyllosphaerae TaxID=274593 RepID=A0A7W5ATT4_9BACL|nr:hypothetical protein [Paenibacillus phyllosphaerae]MBB3108444.1 hypothetical protein [Paenibacillus phyllosphaerae]
MGFNLNYDWETWVEFFKDNWLILLIALVVLWLVIRIVKTVVKWLIVGVIVIGIIVYSGYTLEDVKGIGTKVAQEAKEQAIAAMVGEAKDATFTNNGDGTFTVKTKNVELHGTPGDNKVEVMFRGTKIGTWEIDDTIQALITQAKNNG